MSHFDQASNEWDSPEKVKLMSVLAFNTLKELKLKEKAHILDFGCGTGLFSLAFIDHAKSIHGVDTSEGMLNVFNEKTKDLNFVSSEILDLEKEGNNLKVGQYDLILSSMAFHHLEDPLKVLQKLKMGLSKAGKIALVDLEKEDGSFHPDPKAMGVKHFGFSSDTLKEWANIGKMHVEIKTINHIEKNEKTYRQFLAIFTI